MMLLSDNFNTNYLKLSELSASYYTMKTITVQRLHNFTGHNDCVYTLQQADQPHLFFSGSGDGMIVLWNLEKPGTGELIANLPNSVYALHLHKPSGLLVVGHNYNGIHLLDWQTKTEKGSLQMTKAPIFDIQSYGSRIFVGDKEGMLSEIDITRVVITNRVKVSDKSIRSIAILPETGELAVGCSDHFIRIYDLVTLELKKEWEAHQNSVFILRYTPDGNYLLSGSRDARLKTWDIRAGYIQAAEVVAHMHTINHIDFSPDSKHFVTCSMDKSIKVWDLDEMRLLKVIDKGRHAGHGTSVNKLLWTTHQSQLVSASDDRTISVWDIDINQGLDA
jgi:WD40 repeat protein